MIATINNNHLAKAHTKAIATHMCPCTFTYGCTGFVASIKKRGFIKHTVAGWLYCNLAN